MEAVKARAQPPPLPVFGKPPVTEVVLGIEFTPLQKFKTAHAGRYWGEVLARYPDTEQRAPVSSAIEKFGDDFWQRRGDIQFEMLDPEAVRHWFVSEDKVRLIQLQRDRFIVNWRKATPDTVYPRYDADLRLRFIEEYTQFRDFLRAGGIGDPDVQQCEVTYVNDVPAGAGWATYPEALGLISSWTCKGSDGFLEAPSNLTLAGSFDMPDQKGRLHFSFQRLRRNNDQVEVVQLSLTARGKPESSKVEDIVGWLDVGREWVVRGFSDLTSEKAHKLWDRA